jgi:RNA polymerase sigma factor (sigma-70 family)
VTPLISTPLLRTQSDERLVSLARDGHERAFTAIVERYRRPLHRYLRRILPESRCEDALQQAFMSAWTALSGGTDVRDLRAWLYRIAHNAALDLLRKDGYDFAELSESLHGAEAPQEDLERRTVMRETLAGVAALPERQREALLQTAVEGRSRAEIALELGITEGAVRQLVHRARAALRAAATAITPFPLLTWSMGGATSPAGVSAQRVTELAAGAGGAGALAKTAAVLVTTAVLVGAPVAVVTHGTRSAEAGAAASAQATRQPGTATDDHPTGAPSRSSSTHRGRRGPSGSSAREDGHRRDGGTRNRRRDGAELSGANDRPTSHERSGGERSGSGSETPGGDGEHGSSGSTSSGDGEHSGSGEGSSGGDDHIDQPQAPSTTTTSDSPSEEGSSGDGNPLRELQPADDHADDHSDS